MSLSSVEFKVFAALGLLILLRALFGRISSRRSKWLRPWNPGFYVKGRRGGRTVFEHRAIAERILRRKLKPHEVVHHINGRRNDNLPENLCVMHRKAHEAYHAWYRRARSGNRKAPQIATQLKELESRYSGILLAKHR